MGARKQKPIKNQTTSASMNDASDFHSPASVETAVDKVPAARDELSTTTAVAVEINQTSKPEETAKNNRPQSAKKIAAAPSNGSNAPKAQKKGSVSPSRVPLPIRKSKSLGNILTPVAVVSTSPSTLLTKDSKTVAVPKNKANLNVAARTDSGLTKTSIAILTAAVTQSQNQTDMKKFKTSAAKTLTVATNEKKITTLSRKESVTEIKRSSTVDLKKSEATRKLSTKAKPIVIQPAILKSENDRLKKENSELKKKLDLLASEMATLKIGLAKPTESQQQVANVGNNNAEKVIFEKVAINADETSQLSSESAVEEKYDADFELDEDGNEASVKLPEVLEIVEEEEISKAESARPKRGTRGRKKDAVDVVVLEFGGANAVDAVAAEAAEAIEPENFKASRSRRGTKV
ncbi:hypothetical protein HK100_004210 [Physocladia obscura]|uniref:Uncharacterized protein n=1 Tax=Physocladia obscura TaxID=109957 RepID=A0AAD5SU43_9FUNG|nr:hypothetical protein HK100_004210 [Physocladia obscura]